MNLAALQFELHTYLISRRRGPGDNPQFIARSLNPCYIVDLFLSRATLEDLIFVFFSFKAQNKLLLCKTRAAAYFAIY